MREEIKQLKKKIESLKTFKELGREERVMIKCLEKDIRDLEAKE